MVNTYAVQSGGCRFESLRGFGFCLKGAHYEVDYCGKKTFLAGLQCTLTSSCAIMISNNRNIQLYVHRKIEFVTVNQNSLNYGGGKIVFHRSVVKACFVFRNHHCPILKIALHRLQLRIMSGPAGIRFNQSCLVVRPDGNFPIRCTSNSCTQKQYT